METGTLALHHFGHLHHHLQAIGLDGFDTKRLGEYFTTYLQLSSPGTSLILGLCRNIKCHHALSVSLGLGFEGCLPTGIRNLKHHGSSLLGSTISTPHHGR